MTSPSGVEYHLIWKIVMYCKLMVSFQSAVDGEDCCLSLGKVNYPKVPCGCTVAHLGTLVLTLGTTCLVKSKQYVVFRWFDSSGCLSVYKCRLRESLETFLVISYMMFLLSRACILYVFAFNFSRDLFLCKLQN